MSGAVDEGKTKIHSELKYFGSVFLK